MMASLDHVVARLSDPRFSGLVIRRGPAWVVGADGRLLLANAAGVAALGATRLETLIDAALPLTSALRREVVRMARTLPANGEARLERLRLPGVAAFAPITAACRRMMTPDLGDLVLVAALDDGGDRPAQREAVARLIAAASDEPVLVCASDGVVLARSGALTSPFDSLARLADADAQAADGFDLSTQPMTLGTLSLTIARPQRRAEPAGADEPRAALAPIEAPVAVAPEAASADEASTALVVAVADVVAEQAAATSQADETPTVETPTTLIAESEDVAEPSADTEAEQVEPAAPVTPPRAPRRFPVRFVWQTDADSRMTQVSPELADAVGPVAAAIVGETFTDLARRLGFDADGRVARAMTKRDTWSGVGVTWPTDDGCEALIDLAGLPVFDRDRAFRGYRGFGVCREVVAATTPRPADAAIAELPRSEPAARPEPPVLIATPANVVSLRTPSAEGQRIALSPGERSAFQEIGRRLGSETPREIAPEPKPSAELTTNAPTTAPKFAAPDALRAIANGERAVLDRLPMAVVVHRGETILYANRALLDLTGHDDLDALARDGGLTRIFDTPPVDDGDRADKPLMVRGAGGVCVPVEARLFTAPWEGDSALVLMMRRLETTTDDRIRAVEQALRTAEAAAREQQAILDTATDGVILTDRDGRIVGANKAAEALFGYDAHEFVGRSITMLFATESHRAALDYLDGLVRGGVASVLNDGREVIGRVREGGLLSLFMTMGRLDDDGAKLCAVFRDISQWKRAEDELVAARRAAERASSHKSDFLAKISHEIRTPLNAIIGFSEVMMEERFGPIGNPRYKEYLQDIHISGTHVVSLVNDLLDLSKIEAGKLDLNFTSVDLNDMLTQSMAIMQPQANRQRIIIRTSLAPDLPPVVADPRSMRQIALNLLSNSIKFTQPGGQVILSTALSDKGEVTMRVRDTGIGMSEVDMAAALEPFRQITTSSQSSGDGTGLGLPLTKALVEANRASFAIKSAVNSGTLVEVTFPATRVLAE